MKRGRKVGKGGMDGKDAGGRYKDKEGGGGVCII